VAWDSRASLGVVLAAGGYPGSYRKGDVIDGLDGADGGDCKIFHAGTAERDGAIVTAGGVMLCAVCLGDSVREAQGKAHALASRIHWRDMFYRSDIGHRAIARGA